MTSLADEAASAQTGPTPKPFVDPLFNAPYVDKDEWRETPYRHRYVHGGFTGTEARFAFYFPPKEQYQGRFFQMITPVPVSENSSEGDKGEADYIGSTLAAGGYYVRSNQGGFAATGSPGSPVDGTIAAYRVSAAAAEYSRQLAMAMYGGKRPYGYCFGGSGGSYRTIGGFENTEAWDGAVPFVMPIPHAVPTAFTVRLHALQVVGDKFAQVVDAVDPGGSGDMYAALNADEAAALREATRLGFPPRTWFLYKEMGWGPFSNVYDLVKKNDPTYFTDFWTVPGYLGANPPEWLKKARIQHRSRVKRVVMTNEAFAAGLPPLVLGYKDWRTPEESWVMMQNRWSARPFPVAFELEDPPLGQNLEGSQIIVNPGDPHPRAVSSGRLVGNLLMVSFTPVSGSMVEITGGIKPGDTIQIDNSDVLASQTYHRHIPAGPELYGWNQFRKPDGSPMYPLRGRPVGPLFVQATAGAQMTGRFMGKMIVVQNSIDEDAFPWFADWYRNKVRDHFGPRTDDVYRIYFTDCALHVSSEGHDFNRVVNYRGMLQQALRDLSAWVERGESPPDSTAYRLEDDAQVVLASTAAQRKGIQPVVSLTANGGPRAEVRAGQAVELVGHIEAPPRAGAVVAADWDFEGTGKFTASSPVTPAPRVEVRQSHSWSKPGTYFVALRGVGQREGDAATPYNRLYNLGRVRVVVT